LIFKFTFTQMCIDSLIFRLLPELGHRTYSDLTCIDQIVLIVMKDTIPYFRVKERSVCFQLEHDVKLKCRLFYNT